MITGRSDSELLIERAKWLGNFMTSRMDKDGNTQYQLQFHMRVPMRRRLKRKYEKERIEACMRMPDCFTDLTEI